MTYAREYNLRDIVQESKHPNVDFRSKETAQYIAEMLLQLRQLARHNDFLTLQGVLEIAYYEAFAEAHKTLVPVGEIEHLEKLGADFKKSNVA